MREFWDLWFRDFFNEEAYAPIKKISYPVNIYTEKDEDNETLYIDIVVLNADKEDIEINIEEGDKLRVKYQKGNDQTESTKTYSIHNITKGNFNFGWKIPTKYDISKLEASINNGVLNIVIPHAKESNCCKKIKIK